jgi:uncharacterized protein (TIGR03000 family)
MLFRSAVLSLAIASGLLLTPSDASARGRRGGCCSVSCCVPCCAPCCATHCEGWYWCCDHWVWVDVYCTCGPDKIPGYCYGYIPKYCTCGCVWVIRCFYCHGKEGEAAQPKAELDHGRASLVVHVPANATLTIDGQPTTSTGDRRVYLTPPLDPTKTHAYEVQAEILRNGRPDTVSRRVFVQAGRETELRLDFPGVEVAAR